MLHNLLVLTYVAVVVATSGNARDLMCIHVVHTVN